jgi:hypothetical protein
MIDEPKFQKYAAHGAASVRLRPSDRGLFYKTVDVDPYVAELRKEVLQLRYKLELGSTAAPVGTT